VRPAAESVLRGLRDVRGILGSFLVSREGDVLARDLAPVFSDETLAEAGPRIARLAEAFAGESDKVLSCAVSFSEYMLSVRPLERGLLCALSTLDTQAPALRMGLNLAARRLSELLIPGR
jgi:hypothetical protein